MSGGVRQLLGLVLASVSFVGFIILCALPQWRITTVNNFAGPVVYSEGLWKSCVTFRLTKCEEYETVSRISRDLQAARVLVVIANIVGMLAILLGVAGSSKLMNFVETKFIVFVTDERQKSKMSVTSGVASIIAAIFVFIPVCWTTSTINGDFNNPLLPFEPQRRELGASLYIGWVTTVLLFLGGGLLCSSFLCRNGNHQDITYNPSSV